MDLISEILNRGPAGGRLTKSLGRRMNSSSTWIRIYPYSLRNLDVPSRVGIKPSGLRICSIASPMHIREYVQWFGLTSIKKPIGSWILPKKLSMPFGLRLPNTTGTTYNPSHGEEKILQT